MKTILHIFMALFCTSILFSQVVVDSVDIYERNYMYSQANDLRILSNDSTLFVGDYFFIRMLDNHQEEKYEFIKGVTDAQIIDLNISLRSISQQGDDIYIAGDKGTILKFNTFGDYDFHNSNTTNDLIKIENCEKAICFADDQSNIYTTKDFVTVNMSPLESKVNDILYHDSKIYLACDDGIAYYSTNYGQSWEKAEIGEDNSSLTSITVDDSGELFWSCTSIIHTDSNLNVIDDMKINFDNYSITNIENITYINSNKFVIIFQIDGDYYSDGIYDREIDSILVIESNLSSPKQIPQFVYSNKQDIGCQYIPKLNHSFFNSNDLLKKMFIRFKWYIYPKSTYVLKVISIDDNSFLALREQYLARTNITNLEIENITLMEEKTKDNKRADYKFLGYVNDKLFCLLDTVTSAVGKKIDGTSRLLISTDDGYNWEYQTEPEHTFSEIVIDRDFIIYNANNSTYKISHNGAESWVDISLPMINELSTLKLFPIGTNTFVSMSKDSNGVCYYKTTDNGVNWRRLEWYDTTKYKSFFNNIHNKKNFVVFKDNLTLFLKSKDVKYMSRDGMETFQKFEAMENDVYSILLNGMLNDGRHYFVDQRNIYLSSDDFHTMEIIPHTLSDNNDDYNYFGITSTIDGKAIYKQSTEKLVYVKLDFLLSVIDRKDMSHVPFKIFPNPTSDFINFDQSNLSFNVGMIVDANGRKIKLVSEFNSSLDVSDLESGTYFLVVVDNDGNLYKSKFNVLR